jgi:predicted MFS family arabinose efflux permease
VTGKRLAALRVLGAALAAQSAISFSEQGIPTIGIFIKHDLSLSAAAAGALVSALGVGRIAAFYPAGIAVDRFGETRILFLASIGVGAGVVLAAFAPYWGMLACFAVAGGFLAAASPAGGKLVFSAVPRHRRGVAMGLRQAGVPLGGLLAAAALPPLAEAYGWRTAVFAAGVVSAVGGSSAMVVAGLRRGTRDGEQAKRRAWRYWLRDREFVLVTAWGCVLVGGQYALLTFFAIDVQARTGISGPAAAVLVIALQLGGIVGRIGWGLFIDRRPGLRRRGAFIALTGLGVASAAGLALPVKSLLLIVPLGLLAGLSINGWQGIWTARIVEIAGLERAGSTTGLALTFIGLSITVTTPVYGVIADVSGSYRAIWIALAAALGVATALVWLVPEINRDRPVAA